MSLATTVLINALKAAGNKASLNNGLTAQQRRDTYNEEVAAAHETFVKSGLVTVSVTTTGNATNHSGGGTGSIT